jgi:hypothetical protein
MQGLLECFRKAEASKDMEALGIMHQIILFVCESPRVRWKLSGS